MKHHFGLTIFIIVETLFSRFFRSSLEGFPRIFGVGYYLLFTAGKPNLNRLWEVYSLTFQKELCMHIYERSGIVRE